MKTVFSARLVHAALLLCAFVFVPVPAHGYVAAGNSPQRQDSRPQTPIAPFPYTSTDVHFPGGADGVVLAGTWTQPRTQAPKACIVLIHGSGMTDRNEAAYGHQPFLVLADALTRAGYGVLRYDKRGVAKSTGDFRSATTLDFQADAAAAIAHLKAASGTKDCPIAIIGHSEGGTIAALMSADPTPAAAAISLAGMIAPFQEQLIAQEITTGRDAGADERYAQAMRRFYAEVIEATRETDPSVRRARMQSISHAWKERFADDKVNRAAAADSLLAHPGLIASAWFQTLMRLDVRSAIRRGHIPILFLNGSTDQQVAAEANIEAARQALGGESALRRTRILPGLNHLMQQSATGSGEDYEKITQTFSPQALAEVVRFLNQVFTPPAK